MQQSKSRGELTRESILAMEAGYEMDLLIAERIFGWRWVYEDGEQPEAVPFLIGPPGTTSVHYPKVAANFPHLYPANGLKAWSRSISDAWEVVEKMRANGSSSLTRSVLPVSHGAHQCGDIVTNLVRTVFMSAKPPPRRSQSAAQRCWPH